MAPKSGEKKPAQPAKKAVAKKSSAGRKKGFKKAVESYKIYIYKVCSAWLSGLILALFNSHLSTSLWHLELTACFCL